MVDIVDLGSASESDDKASDSDESSSYGIDPDDINDNLDELLRNINPHGSFACSVDLRLAFVDPKITVEGVGPIQLPLNPETARAIAQACHQAPFGRGEETVIDPSVRNTWELNPEKFSITEPRWNKDLMPRVLATVQHELGVSSPFHAKRYKMLLYEKGAMFKVHRDTEKTPGMFGTLVICLPSPHEGGDVHASHAKNTKILTSSDFMPSCIAWYSDVEHEVKEVISGYRWVLTYNLIANGPPGSLSAATTLRDRATLRNNLKAWKTEYMLDPSYLSRVVYLLDHQYTDASLRLDSLKSHDRKIAIMFQETCDSLGLEMFLASFERMRMGAAEPNESDDNEYGYNKYGYTDYEDWDAPEREKSHHVIDDEFDSLVKLTRVVDRFGTEVATDVEIDMHDIIQENSFEEDGPDDEDYEGYTGNAGCTATHWYRRVALVIVPRDHVGIFLLSQFVWSSPSNGQWGKPTEEQRLRGTIKYLEGQQRMNSSELERRDSLVHVCHYALSVQQNINRKAQPRTEKHDELLGAIVSAAGSMNDVFLFNQATALVRTELPPDDLQSVSRWLCTGSFQLLRRGLNQALPRACVISSWWEYLVALKDSVIGVEDEEKLGLLQEDQDFEAWKEEKLTHVLQNASKVWSEDSVALAWIWKHEKNTSGRHERILQLLQNNSTNTAALIRFLIFFSLNPTLETAIADPKTFKTVLNFILHGFSLSMDARTIALKAAYLKKGERLPPVDSDMLAELLLHLRDVGFHGELSTLAQMTEAEISRMNVLDLDLIFSEFLEGFVKPHWHSPADPMSQPFRSLFQTTIKQYLLRYVRTEPTREPDWAMAGVSCYCLKCQELNDFLRDPTERVWRFRGNKKERHHVHQKLDYTSCDHRTNHLRDPNTMVITKTVDKNAPKRERWTTRAAVFDEKMGELGKFVDLPQLLGDEYSIIMSKTYAQRATAAPAGPASRAAVAGPSGTRPPLGPPLAKGTSSAAHSTQPLASQSGNAQRAPATPGPSNARGPTSTPLRNTPGLREAVKRKAAEMESVDLTPLRNTEEMRREVKQKTTEVEVLDLTED